jgi:hypothetical protein
MPSRQAPALALAPGRRAFPWLVGAAAFLLRPRVLELADPSACRGVLDVIAYTSLAMGPYVSVGTVLRTLDTIVVVGAIAGLTELFLRTTGSYAVSAAVAIAVGLSPLFPPTVGTPQAAGVCGACVAAALIAMREDDAGSRGWLRPAVQVIALLGVATLIAPVWCGGAADLSMRGSAGLGHATVWALGPLAIGLAVLGAFVRSRSHHTADHYRVGVAAALTVMLTIGGVRPEAASVPMVLIGWWLVAIGLHETIIAIGWQRAGRIGCVILLVAVPALQAARRTADERDDRVRPNGQPQLTLQRARAFLNVIDVNASIVEEDASMDLLLRAALVNRRQATPRFSVIARDPDVVAAALARGPVYAFPRGQLELGLRGFVMRPVTTVARRRDRAQEQISGLARITERGACYAIGNDWAAIGQVSASGRIAVVAASDAAVGPVELRFGGPSIATPSPDGWSPRMMRGFHARTYDRRRPADAELLATEAHASGAPSDRVLSSPFVLTLYLYRTPRGPLALPVTLGAAFPLGVARLDAAAASQQLSVCDASATAVTPIGARPWP